MWLAQKGTHVAVVEADGIREAAEAAAEALRLPRPTIHYRRQVRGPLPVDHAWLRPRRLVDWSGVTLRPATPAEVERFRAAHDQDRALSSRAKVKAAVR